MGTSRSLRWSWVAVLSLVVVIALTSCSKKEVKEDEPLISPSADTGAAAAPATEPVDTAAVPTPETVTTDATAPEMQIAYFEFDSYRISSQARDALDKNASWLKSNPTSTVQIEGHCDERGTTEYNLALGERRANAAKDYLIRQGIDRSRLSVISYGEERPLDPGHTEEAWGRNRRAAFVILSR